MGHWLKIKSVDSRVNMHILAATSVPFTLSTVPVPNLALNHTKRMTVYNMHFIVEESSNLPCVVQESSNLPCFVQDISNMHFMWTKALTYVVQDSSKLQCNVQDSSNLLCCAGQLHHAIYYAGQL
jgi:hypothetical protein